MQTQALVNEAVGAPFVLTDVELDEPQPNEVLVQIVASGLCHTDFMIQNGGIPSAFPSIQGHEGAGKVVAVGSEVGDELQVGDSVLLSFASCSSCDLCRSHRPAGCAEWVAHNFGRRRNKAVEDKPVATVLSTGLRVKGSFFGQSSFARHAVVQASSCVKVPTETDLVLVSPLGCGLQTGAGAVINVLRPRPDDSLVVFGLGAVGFAALFAAAYLNVKTTIVVDLIPSRLALAKELGAHHALDGTSTELVQEIKRLTGGGANYAIDEGSPQRVGVLGVCCLGNPGPGVASPFEIHDMVNTGKAWRGSVEGDSNPPEFIPFLMDLYKQGKFPVDRLCQVFPVERWDEAVLAMKSGAVIKPIITF
ncbi:hypothetical protein JCM10212_002899 [Sporobolomyces blumeae]